MKYIILDLEWNQPYCMKNAVKHPVLLTGEIIQIGAVKLDENFNYAGNLKLAVRPKFYRKINTYVKKITKISNTAMNNGTTFKEAFEVLSNWCGNDFVFFTWGNEDIPMLHDNMIVHGLNPEWIPNTYNLQIIYNAQISHENRQFSLAYAVSSVNEEFKEAHDALNDSMSTYNLCKHLDLAAGIESYEEEVIKTKKQKSKAESPEIICLMYETEIPYEEYRSFICPKCGKTILCTGVLSQNKDKKISIAECECGERFFVRFKLKKQDGNTKITRIVYELDEKSEALYFKLKEKQCENRRKFKKLSKKKNANV